MDWAGANVCFGGEKRKGRLRMGHRTYSHHFHLKSVKSKGKKSLPKRPMAVVLDSNLLSLRQ